MSRVTEISNDRLGRLASWCARRRRRVAIMWAAVFVAVTAASMAVGGEHRADYSMPGSESAAVRELLYDRFPERAGDPVYVVAHADTSIADPGMTARLSALGGELAGMEHVAEVGASLPAPDGRTAVVTVILDDRAEAIPAESIEALMERTAAASGSGLQIELGGWAVQYAEQGSAGKEGIGLVAALVILLAAFGSLLAAGIPIVLALVGLGVGSGVSMLVANIIDIPEWGSMLAAMIGIGVGIDYALFIVTRYRNALANGVEPHQAVIEAMTTSGRAVLFAGGTVVVSLLGLGIIGLEYMWGAAIAMVLGVLGVLAAAITLLPAVLGFTGRHIDRLRLPRVGRNVGRSQRWAAWSRRVQRRPVLAGLVAVAVLLGLAAPVLDMRFGFPDAGSNPTSLTSRRAYDLTASAFGPGANGPLVVAVEARSGDAEEVGALLATAIAADAGVAAVVPSGVDADRSAVLLTVVPTTGPQDVATEQLVRRLRSDVLPTAVADTDVRAVVGGLTALFVDEADYEASRLPWFIAAVLGLSFVLLLVVFRAPLVALKAAVLNLLGISAAYGVIALAVQGGWFGGLFGIHEPTPVPVFVPILMFALLFGLSMDYEVFLLSRIREEHQSGATNSDAVVEGIATTARVITAAAAIMVVVFGAFVLNDEVIAKVAGLGLATAVLLDATLVRMVLVPATMEVLGERNWWIPRWLDRRLPRFHVEPTMPPEVQPATN
ncbi:MAG TPA: MMPL family transporter [Ilumatobacteraceae bacterium]|nr:MMPL family transporter [Ilumatobacteraceae bacterium]